MTTLRVFGVCLLLTAMVMTCGCNPFQPKPPEAVVDTYAQAQSKAAVGDYAGASALLDQYVAANPSAKYSTDAWLLLGDCRMKVKDYPAAQNAYQQAQIKPRTTVINARAKAGLGNAMSAQKRYAEAAKAYEAALALGEKDLNASQVLLYLGKCYIRSGDWNRGRDRLKQVGDKYPTSVEAPEARDIWTQPANSFSVQVGAFSTQVRAREMVDKLREKGILGALVVERTYATAPYAVRVGNFVDYNAAAAETEKLKAASPEAFVFP